MSSLSSNAKKVWVTGSSGFIGGQVCRLLDQAGLNVLALSRENWDLSIKLPNLPNEPKPDVIVHLAAEFPKCSEEIALESLTRRNRAMDDNVFSFANSVGAAMVFASTGGIYGTGNGEVFEVAGRARPENLYATGKWESERAGMKLFQEAKLPFTALRISAPYGPLQPTNTVIKHFLNLAIQGKTLRYHGSGSREQDFVFVTDVAAAVLACVQQEPKGVFNVACGKSITMRNLALLIAETVNPNIMVQPSGQSDPQEGWTARYDIEATRKALSWEPTTSLSRGLTLWQSQLRESQS